MITDEPDDRRGFQKCLPWAGTGGGVELGGISVRPVRLVLLLLDGPREGENDILEFASVDDAVAYGRQLYGEPQFQLEGIEDAEPDRRARLRKECGRCDVRCERCACRVLDESAPRNAGSEWTLPFHATLPRRQDFLGAMTFLPAAAVILSGPARWSLVLFRLGLSLPDAAVLRSAVLTGAASPDGKSAAA